MLMSATSISIKGWGKVVYIIIFFILNNVTLSNSKYYVEFSSNFKYHVGFECI
jgi:hypothetical protein